ncbi:hypothetical protein I6J48_17715 [Acinetobacter calcoaceticus]|uniref:hypothetical protein n=1 Tax=Acinetobacter calcoaceticus TaxID=471 RepID=UPI001966DCA9|nr:hypothetical protein [Acinetobacter calcoaceticus]QSB53991.1 hypothetical protein I6J48_17715 [Acinetobacter calcoaceticus]
MTDFNLVFKENYMWKQTGFISVFDHWLTEDEADDCKILNYEISIEREALQDYMGGEEKFIKFYRNISDIVVCNKTDNIKVIQTNSNEFEDILMSSLREENMKFLDIFYPEHKIRFKGGYDRTDTFFLADESNFCFLKEYVDKSNLFILGFHAFESEDLI